MEGSLYGRAGHFATRLLYIQHTVIGASRRPIRARARIAYMMGVGGGEAEEEDQSCGKGCCRLHVKSSQALGNHSADMNRGNEA